MSWVSWIPTQIRLLSLTSTFFVSSVIGPEVPHVNRNFSLRIYVYLFPCLHNVHDPISTQVPRCLRIRSKTAFSLFGSAPRTFYSLIDVQPDLLFTPSVLLYGHPSLRNSLFISGSYTG